LSFPIDVPLAVCGTNHYRFCTSFNNFTSLVARSKFIRQISILYLFDKENFDMRSLNLDQLRTLIEVVEHRSFSAAARRLNLTQPAVSLHIRELERRFGVRLIERLGKQAHATPPGLELVAAAERIFRECSLATDAMRRFRDGNLGRVHIGTTLTAMTYQLPAILRGLHNEHPGIDIVVTTMATQDSVEGILQNKIDLALITLPVDKRQLKITPLTPNTMVAILPSGTRNVPAKITPDYAVQQTILTDHARSASRALVMRWLSGVANMPREPMQLGTIEALKSAVAAKLGIALVPDVAVAGRVPNIVVRPLQPPLPCTLALIEHRSKPNEPALDIVRAALLSLRTL
jgi:DNA-binding transcriptional LysR family regulator